MNKNIPKPADLDNPWRRLTWVLPSTFIIWGVLLWVFGLVLGHMAGLAGQPAAIDARVIELPAPIRPAMVLKQPERRVIPKSSPPQLPAPVQQPTVQSPSREPVTPSPAVSLPDTKAPPGNLTVPYRAIDPGVKKSNPKPSLQGSGDAVTPPQFGAAYLNNPKPGYPAFARRMGMEGIVMLKVLVSSQGTALKIEVARSSGYEILDEAATEAVKNWRFVPARKGDSPVEEWVQVPLAFRLKK
jgi:protein TonB